MTASFHELHYWPFWIIISYDIHDFYSSPNIIRVVKSKRKKTGGACGTYGGE